MTPAVTLRRVSGLYPFQSYPTAWIMDAGHRVGQARVTERIVLNAIFSLSDAKASTLSACRDFIRSNRPHVPAKDIGANRELAAQIARLVGVELKKLGN